MHIHDEHESINDVIINKDWRETKGSFTGESCDSVPHTRIHSSSSSPSEYGNRMKFHEFWLEFVHCSPFTKPDREDRGHGTQNDDVVQFTVHKAKKPIDGRISPCLCNILFDLILWRFWYPKRNATKGYSFVFLIRRELRWYSLCILILNFKF